VIGHLSEHHSVNYFRVPLTHNHSSTVPSKERPSPSASFCNREELICRPNHCSSALTTAHDDFLGRTFVRLIQRPHATITLPSRLGRDGRRHARSTHHAEAAGSSWRSVKLWTLTCLIADGVHTTSSEPTIAYPPSRFTERALTARGVIKRMKTIPRRYGESLAFRQTQHNQRTLMKSRVPSNGPSATKGPNPNRLQIVVRRLLQVEHRQNSTHL